MDLQNVPPLKMSKEIKEHLQNMIKENYEESKDSFKEVVEKMRKEGYSDAEINKILLI